MWIKKLFLGNFRNHVHGLWEFDQQVNILLGNNAAGKSTILEAIYLLASGTSLHAQRQAEMINWQADYARVSALVELSDGGHKLEVICQRAGEGVSKQFKLDDQPVSRNKFVRMLAAVMFVSHDLRVISGSPARRRRFWNRFLGQHDLEYARSLAGYQRALRARNKLLKQIASQQADSKELFFWDKILVKNASYIQKKRREWVTFLNRELQPKYQINYLQSGLDANRLQQMWQRDLERLTTGIGPHRDDWQMDQSVAGQWRGLAEFGSAGEQRMAVLALKRLELDYWQQTLGERPILLLDDVYSELDHQHRQALDKLTAGQQTFLTTADRHLVAQEGNLINL